MRDFTRFCSAECEESQKLSFIFEDLEDRMKAREESIKETKTNTVFFPIEPAGSSFFGGFKIRVILE